MAPLGRGVLEDGVFVEDVVGEVGHFVGEWCGVVWRRSGETADRTERTEDSERMTGLCTRTRGLQRNTKPSRVCPGGGPSPFYPTPIPRSRQTTERHLSDAKKIPGPSPASRSAGFRTKKKCPAARARHRPVPSPMHERDWAATRQLPNRWFLLAIGGGSRFPILQRSRSAGLDGYGQGWPRFVVNPDIVKPTYSDYYYSDYLAYAIKMAGPELFLV